MTLQELIEKRPSKLTVPQAAEIMGVTPRFLQCALQQGKLPFGVAVEMGRFVYYINVDRFIAWMCPDKAI